jgi:hypothetical protein
MDPPDMPRLDAQGTERPGHRKFTEGHELHALIDLGRTSDYKALRPTLKNIAMIRRRDQPATRLQRELFSSVPFGKYTFCQ